MTVSAGDIGYLPGDYLVDDVSPKLKRLGFVRTYSGYYFNWVRPPRLVV